MASNGLVANAGKTVFMILNLTKKECESELTKELTIDGATIPRSEATKLVWKSCYKTCVPQVKRDNAKDLINLSTIAAILPHAVYD